MASSKKIIEYSGERGMWDLINDAINRVDKHGGFCVRLVGLQYDDMIEIDGHFKSMGFISYIDDQPAVVALWCDRLTARGLYGFK